MAKQNQVTVGVRLPPIIIKQMDADISTGEYYSRSDWVRQACREFYKKRLEQNNLNKR